MTEPEPPTERTLREIATDLFLYRHDLTIEMYEGLLRAWGRAERRKERMRCVKVARLNYSIGVRAMCEQIRALPDDPEGP